jgi:sec-independent protein translocase protein TatA
MGIFSGEHILIIAALIFLFFGATAIPKFAKSIGQAKGEFEKGVRESKEASEKAAAEKAAEEAKKIDTKK